MARNVYRAIMKAAERGVGLRLTAEECWQLSRDDAISTVADNVDRCELVPYGYDNVLVPADRPDLWMPQHKPNCKD